jgi:hypothetical protein
MSRTGAVGLAADLETDGQGRFEAPELAEGDYRIDISRPNYLGTTVRLHLSSAGAATSVRLIRCAVITGHVTDRNAQPVRGATVFAMARPPAGMPLERDFTPGHYANVDEGGDYRLFNLPPGEYLVAVSYGASGTRVGSAGSAPPPGGTGSGFAYYPDNARPQWIALASGEERRNLSLSIFAASLYSVAGIVRHTDPKTSFWLALSALNQPEIAVAVTPASKDDAFRLEGIPPGSYTLTAFGPTTGYGGRGAVLKGDALFARTSVEVGGANVEGLVLFPEKGKAVTFVLRAGAGAGASCPGTARMMLAPVDDIAAMIERHVTLKVNQDETVPFLAPVHYSMALRDLGDNCILATDPVFDVSQVKGPMVVTMAAAGSIRGRLNTGGQPGSDFLVVLLAMDDLDGSSGVVAVVPDAQSQFVFRGLRAGRYRIAARAADQTRWLAGAIRPNEPPADPGTEIQVRAGANLEIDLAVPVRQERKP